MVLDGSGWFSKYMAPAVILFEGVCVNYRHPDPRRGEPRVGSAPDVAFPVDPVDPVDPLDPVNPVQSSGRLKNHLFYNDFGTFCRNWGPIFGLLRPDVWPDVRPDVRPDIRPDFRPDVWPDIRTAL